MWPRHRRHDLRIVAALPAVVHPVRPDGELGPPLSATVLDLSAGGSRVVVHAPVLPGSSVCLRVGEGTDELALSATAAVVWRDRPAEGLVTIGLRFTGLGPRARADLSRRLDALVHRQRPSPADGARRR
jgi:c-di-GMP-binding flagellar brake protein YcgR